MGTGEFALPAFRALYNSDHQVVALFTQPDRTGRGHHHHPHPMKDEALRHNTPVFQPEKANAPESLNDLRTLRPDLCVVAAYGQILSAALLEIPRLGAVNVHASLLPRHRGAAPVQYAILSGDTETGISIFQIDPKLDAGPILGVERLTIRPDETAGELEARLAELAAPLTLQVVRALETNTARPVVQDASLVTRAPRIPKTAGAVDWSLSCRQIARHVRAMQPWPTSFTFLERNGQPPLRLILLEVAPVETPRACGAANAPSSAAMGSLPPGSILAADGEKLTVQCGEGALDIVRLRPEGKRAMATSEFLRGHHITPGERLVSGLAAG